MFGLKEEQKLHTVVAFGYPSHTSKMEDAKDGNIKYYLDENKDYVVPKRKLEDIVKYFQELTQNRYKISGFGGAIF